MEESMQSAKPRSHPRLRAVCCWSLKSPWWMKLHIVIYTFWTSYWLSEGNACGSLICHFWAMPLISHLRKPLHSWVKTSKGSFFCSLLRNTAETTRRANHSEWDMTPLPDNVNEKWRIIMSTLEIYKLLSCYCQTSFVLYVLYDCLGVIHWYRHGAHILLSQEFWAMVLGFRITKEW